MATLEGFVRWIRRCNTENYRQSLLPLKCGLNEVGYCKPSFVEHLARFPKVFKVTKKTVSIRGELDSSEKRTATIADVLAKFRDEGVITGWRDEMYPVTENFYSEPCFLIERAAAIHFGIRSYGVHMNGFVETENGMKLWVAKRSRHKPTWPGKLDHICAGGQPHGISPMENMVKECLEEASIPEQLARQALPEGGVKRDCLFVYDLQLPADFQPEPADAEVEEFKLMDTQDVADMICTTDDFKDNVNLVIIDFLIRRSGLLRPESPGYLDLVRGLRQGECS